MKMQITRVKALKNVYIISGGIQLILLRDKTVKNNM